MFKMQYGTERTEGFEEAERRMEEARERMNDWKVKYDEITWAKAEQDAIDFEEEQRRLRDEADE
jgi:hypothetical protein